MDRQLLTPENIASEVWELAALTARSDIEREIIEAALMSVIAAMERVAPAARAELQTLMAAFTLKPDDKDVVAGIGAILREARLPHH